MKTRFRLAAAAIGCLLSCAAGQAARAANYPTTTGGNFGLRLRFVLLGQVSPGVVTIPANGYFKFANGSPDVLHGGRFQVIPSNDTPVNPAWFDQNNVTFPLDLTEDSVFTSGVPRSLRDQIHVQVTCIRNPHALPNAGLAQTAAFQAALTGIEDSAFDFPHLRSAHWECNYLLPWVDSDVTIRYEVWLDPSVADPSYNQGRFVQEFQLRTEKNAFYRLSPYLVPVSLIGQPPGNGSWSRLTMESGAGAGLTVMQSSGNARTVQDSIGFGPFTSSSPTVTTSRSKAQSVQQTMSTTGSLGLWTHDPATGPAPYVPGHGDLLCCLVRPTFSLYSAWQDMDFRYLAPTGAPSIAFFPMHELTAPQPGTPPAQLTAAERAAFLAIDPLVADPRAVLDQPRFYRVLTLAGVTGALNGGNNVSVITRDDVNQAMGTTTITDNSSSFSLPLGAIGSAVGAALPPLDLLVRHSETDVSSVEYRTTDVLQSSSTRLAEYHIADSDPRRWLFTEVYYDTAFHSFLFRDASLPPATFLPFTRDYKIDSTRLPRWLIVREELKHGGRYTVAGSLADYVPEGAMAVILPTTGKQSAKIMAAVMPKTGNVMIPGLAPGSYLLSFQDRDGAPLSGAAKATHSLTVTAEGAVTFK